MISNQWPMSNEQWMKQITEDETRLVDGCLFIEHGSLNIAHWKMDLL